jgi:hypothetical protein
MGQMEMAKVSRVLMAVSDLSSMSKVFMPVLQAAQVEKRASTASSSSLMVYTGCCSSIWSSYRYWSMPCFTYDLMGD